MMKPILFAAASLLVMAPMSIAADSVEVGKTAPEITMTGVDGKTFKLSDSAKGGKNVALMFSRANW